MLIKTRRDFLKVGLKSVSALGALGGMAKFGEMNALAANGPAYQALVCVFLNGGNDGHNTVIPLQTVQQNYAQYQAGRPGLALAQNTLLPITTKSGDTYGLHPKLPELQQIYNQKKCAVVANVGMLVKPTTRAQYLSGQWPVPSQLFSHSDQTTQWQNVTPNGIASTGWGGRVIDNLQMNGYNPNAQFPPITNTAGCGLFCVGSNNLPTTVPYTGAISLATMNNVARSAGMQQLLTFDNGMQLVQAANGIISRSNSYAVTLNSLLGSANVNAANFPANNNLASQLLKVAQIIAVRQQLGVTRQIFFCSLGGFDTHSAELATQDMLLQQVSQAIAGFYKTTQDLAVDQFVTTFTCSEFGRTLMPNSSGGTDHAWGSHHFVVGGAVQGGDMYGAYPLLALNTGNDATGRGAMIPGSSVDQYGATLASWFGVDASNPATMQSIFPSIGNFNQQNLGFV